MQANYDKAAAVRSLNPNDKVLVLMPTSGNRLLSTWAGPYVVLKRLENNNYQILIGNRKSTFHIKTLRKFEEANTADGAAAPTTMMIIHEEPTEAKTSSLRRSRRAIAVTPRAR